MHAATVLQSASVPTGWLALVPLEDGGLLSFACWSCLPGSPLLVKLEKKLIASLALLHSSGERSSAMVAIAS